MERCFPLFDFLLKSFQKPAISQDNWNLRTTFTLICFLYFSCTNLNLNSFWWKYAPFWFDLQCFALLNTFCVNVQSLSSYSLLTSWRFFLDHHDTGLQTEKHREHNCVYIHAAFLISEDIQWRPVSHWSLWNTVNITSTNVKAKTKDSFWIHLLSSSSMWSSLSRPHSRGHILTGGKVGHCSLD